MTGNPAGVFKSEIQRKDAKKPRRKGLEESFPCPQFFGALRLCALAALRGKSWGKVIEPKFLQKLVAGELSFATLCAPFPFEGEGLTVSQNRQLFF
jgi:hypothetical protein